MLHDTTEFSFQRERREAIGKIRTLPSCRLRQKSIKKCGLLMHSSLAANTTRIPIEEKESIRWLENLEQSTQRVNLGRCIHIGDCESDIYERFCVAQE